MEKQRSVLIVENNLELLRSMTRRFDEANYQVFKAVTAKGARSILQKQNLDVVVVSRALPDIFSLQICREIKNDPLLQNIIVLLSFIDERKASWLSREDVQIIDGLINLLEPDWFDTAVAQVDLHLANGKSPKTITNGTTRIDVESNAKNIDC